MDYDADLVVIGGGSGGVRAARIAAGHGAKVVLAEEARLGGTCVIRGCIPKKLFVNAGRIQKLFDDAPAVGWPDLAPSFDWGTLVAGKDREIAGLEALYHQAQEKAGVEVVKSRATLEDRDTVCLLFDERKVRTRHILIATGAKPEIPPCKGAEFAITSNEVFDLKHLPKCVVIAGAGYIAMEFAGLFAALGCQVTVVCRGDNVLRGFDPDLRKTLAASYEARGINLLFLDSIVILESERGRNGHQEQPDLPIIVRTHNGARLVADQVIFAVGRLPNTSGLNLRAVGVDMGADGAVLVDENSRTSISNIYAVGDVTHRFNLTPVAIREGHAFADSLFGGKAWAMDYSQIPTAVFTTPEVGTIGLTELQAREQLDHVEIFRRNFHPPRAGMTQNEERGLVKLVVDGRSRRVVGVHLFAEAASEILQGVAVALRMKVTVEEFLDGMALHPTLGEELAAVKGPTVSYYKDRGDPG